MPDRLHLSPKHRRTLEALLREHLPGVEVWAYGSRVNGRSHDGSDLDLVLRGPGLTEIPREQQRDFAEAVRESTIPFLVEARDWAWLPGRFRREIEREHVVLMRPEPDSAQRLWPTREIGCFAEIVGGSTPSTKDRSNFDGDVPWLTPKDLSGSHNRVVFRGSRNLTRSGLASCSAHLLPAGAVLLSTRAPIGYVAIAGGEICTNQGFRSLIPKKGVVSEFLYYWLKQNTRTLEKYASGSTFKELSGSALKKIRVPIPPSPEQRAIAHILGTLDDKIELNRRMNATLEAMARAIFKDWFVDFGPIRAKAEGRAPYLAPEVWNLFPDALDDDDKPAGWKLRKLNEIISITKGRSYKSSELQHSTVALVTLKSFKRGGGYRSDGLKPYTGKYKSEQVVTPGESVIALTDVTQAADVVGKPAIVLEDARFSTLVASLDVGIIRARHEHASRAFVFHLLQTERFQNHAYSNCTGTTVLHLNKDALVSFLACMPPRELMVCFDQTVDLIARRIAANTRESVALGQAQGLFLPKLISGEIRIAEAEKIAEAAG